MSWTHPIRVVGVGSPHGDDALAWEVVEKLKRVLPSQPGIEFYRLDGGQRLLDLVDRTGTLLVIDAFSTGQPAGSIHQLQWPDERLAGLRTGSTHDLGPAQALHLAETLDSLPSQVIIYGIEAARCDPQTSLSPKVAQAIEELVGILASTLTANGAHRSGKPETSIAKR